MDEHERQIWLTTFQTEISRASSVEEASAKAEKSVQLYRESDARLTPAPAGDGGGNGSPGA